MARGRSKTPAPHPPSEQVHHSEIFPARRGDCGEWTTNAAALWQYVTCRRCLQIAADNGDAKAKWRLDELERGG